MEFDWWCDDCGMGMTLEQAHCNCWWYNACDDNAIPSAEDVS